MTMLITKPPTTNGYNTIATGDANPDSTATVPHVTARRSTWTTMFAGMLMLSAGGTVWRMQDVDTPNRTTPAAAGLVQSSGSVQTEEVPRHDVFGPRGGLVVAAPIVEQCFAAPSTAKFSGVSIAPFTGEIYLSHPFETCWKRLDHPGYCWSRSVCYDCGTDCCFGCYPMDGGKGSSWLPIRTAEVKNGLCGQPCQELY